MWPEHTNRLNTVHDLGEHGPAGLDGGSHVWRIGLGATDPEGFLPLLSAEERERVMRFAFARDAQRAIAARGSLRHLLAHYLKLASPAEVALVASTHGKPALRDKRLAFNLSRRDDVMLLVVAQDGPVGIDVEIVRPLDDLDAMARLVLSPAERQDFDALQPEDRPAAFYRLWVRKEALLKAAGVGLGGAPERITLPKEHGAPVTIRSNVGKDQTFYLTDIDPAEGLMGALALPAAATPIGFWSLAWDVS